MTNKERYAKLQYLLDGLSMTKEQKNIVKDIIMSDKTDDSTDNNTDDNIDNRYMTFHIIDKEDSTYEIRIGYFNDDYVYKKFNSETIKDVEPRKEFADFINYIFELDKLREKISDNKNTVKGIIKVINHFDNIVPKLYFNEGNATYSFVSKDYEWGSSTYYSILIENADYKYKDVAYRFVFEPDLTRLICLVRCNTDGTETTIYKTIPLID